MQQEVRCVMQAEERRDAVAVLAVTCGILLLLLAGCASEKRFVPDRIVPDPHASGDDQCGLHGEVLPKPLRAFVESPQVPGMLGGKGSRHPVPKVSVTFEITNPESGAAFEENGQERLTVTTDRGGVAAARLRLGHRSGDVCVVASIETPSGPKQVEFRCVTGVELIQSALETSTDGAIKEVGVRLLDPQGTPAAGVPVYFRVEGQEDKAAVGGKPILCVETDAEGRAAASWKLGTEMRRYFLIAEICDLRPEVPEEARFRARGIEFVAMATNKRLIVVELVGGLAIFVFGMKLMSGGLRRMADRRLKAILQAMTKNRFFAVAVGLGLTAMIQSSSATTVMTVGFVNAGLMTLVQAIGVIYGANVGTTVTGQIIAFKLDAVTYPAIVVGLILTVTRRPFYRHMGEAILGFGLLFLGMMTMSRILEPLRYSAQFVSWFQLFDCTPGIPGGPVKGPQALMCILIGTAATVLVQSSSATVGLLLALTAQGLVSFYTAVPLVVGSNIGTTITAILASLGANRNAKRAALAHTLFNVFGAAYMYFLLFVPLWGGQPIFLGFVDWVTPGEVFGPLSENLPRHVANAHTFFNVCNLLLFLPFVNTMANVCRRIVPLTTADQEQVLQYLEPHLLQSPSLALVQAVKEVVYMVRRAQKSINECCESFYNGDPKAEERIAGREDLIDRLQHEITAYLVDLSRKSLTPEEATLIPALVHAVNDAERIGDHSMNLLELCRRKHQGEHKFSEAALGEVRKLQELLNDQFEATCNSLLNGDSRQVEIVLEKENEITYHMKASSEAHVRRLELEECDVLTGVIFLDLLAHLERVGDHLVNIAERAGTITSQTRS